MPNPELPAWTLLPTTIAGGTSVYLLALTTCGRIPTPGYLPPLLVPAGVALSLYFLVMLPWAMRTLGHLYAPGFAVFDDHTLITAGPFRLVRHPIGSSVLTLLLGAPVGTLNWLLLLLWPMFVALSSLLMARTEEALLHEKFGEEYEEYGQETGRFIPGIW